MVDRCVSNKSSTATAMAIASRALRACDVCGRERAKWYCKADEAYLCEHCDASVHGANTVSLRHERLRLGPNGQRTKNLKRDAIDQSTTKLERVPAPALMQGSRKRPRSSRCPKVKVEPPDESPKAAVTAAAAAAASAAAATAAAEEFFKSFVASSEDEQFFDTDVLVPESAHEVPIFDPLIHEVCSGDVPSDGFSVPSAAGNDEDSPRTDHSVELCFDPFAESEGDLCDMDGIISGTMEMEAISDLGEVLGLCDDSKELCGEAYGLEFPSNLSDSADNATTPSDVGEFCSSKVKLEEADDLDKIKLEVDEMLGFAFNGTNSCVKEEVLEQKPIKLRLNYEDVLNAWSDRGPFWTEGPRPQTVPGDSSFDPTSTWDTGLVPDSSMESLHSGEGVAQVPVVNFSDAISTGGGREARVLRYREKRRTRLFSKKIRYEVRKLNAERRPRLKGRFVKRITM